MNAHQRRVKRRAELRNPAPVPVPAQETEAVQLTRWHRLLVFLLNLFTRKTHA